VYVLYSQTCKKIYIGYTSSLEERFKSHNELAIKGWTIKFRPWEIVHKEIFENKNGCHASRKRTKISQSEGMDLAINK
jgi:putative endonuclease